jgi:hypothetical protein
LSLSFIALTTGAGHDMDKWKEAKDGFDKWLKINCYLAFIWVGFKVLQFLPPDIANRVIEAFLEKLGI